MTDVIKDAFKIAQDDNDNIAMGDGFYETQGVLLDFLKHLRDNGPDKEMKGKPHLFGGFYWGTIKAFLTHVIKRLEEEQNDK